MEGEKRDRSEGEGRSGPGDTAQARSPAWTRGGPWHLQLDGHCGWSRRHRQTGRARGAVPAGMARPGTGQEKQQVAGLRGLVQMAWAEAHVFKRGPE